MHGLYARLLAVNKKQQQVLRQFAEARKLWMSLTENDLMRSADDEDASASLRGAARCKTTRRQKRSRFKATL